MYEYIVFENESEYRAWEQDIINSMGIIEYADPITHSSNEKIIVPYREPVDKTGLKIISENKAKVKGYNIEIDSVKALEGYVSENYDFALKLQKKFVTENIALGITQLGLTEPVSVYLKDIIVDIMNTSFYEAINKIDEKINEGVPANLAPVITEQRLNNFKNIILEYLS